ncbi:MAG TPA: NAD(P)H-binding protein [Gemmatimonadales bacterium]|jgi:uncharacterized protein YbjT (DUF2867 family)|nr:NAD(P)H-binding protein [Gemmatimonadales bacterium]
MRVLLLGATGLVGSECLRQMVADPVFERVLVLARRSLRAEDRAPKVVEQLVDFDQLESIKPSTPVDAVMCALGTTIKQAGSQERFRAIDYGYPLAAARLALAQGARHYLLVSSLGADARSRVFYSRVKGELEAAISALPFRTVSILRPSLLLGDRQERRVGELLMKRVAFLFPPKWRAIHGRDVAAAMLRVAKEDLPGRRIIESAQMLAWARGK